jgi:hypothetical protein
MPKKQFRPELFIQAKNVLSSWVQIDEQMAFGRYTTATLVTALNRANGIENEIRDLENKLTDLRNQRLQNQDEVWNIVKTVRLGVRLTYGDDSSQYEMVGGTRASERKSPRRTVVVPAEPVLE